MPRTFSSWLSMGVVVLGYFCTTRNTAVAQITSDGTLDTQVTQDDSLTTITGGQRSGGNLFHSFQDFSIPTNNEAFFNNASEISRIFSRVTGGNISNIDGVIRANGSASLYLINPAGIIFGQNASLNIGGSFLATTANSILFEEGEFSAVNLDSPPLLTIDAPIGLDLRNNSAKIVNRSQYREETIELGDFEPDAPIFDGDLPDLDFDLPPDGDIIDFETPPVGLQVKQGQSISFSGGSILFDGGLATAPGGEINLEATGDIELKAESEADFIQRSTILNTISLAENGGDITLNSTGGNITISGFNLTSGSLDDLVADASGGNLTINAIESVNLANSSINTTTNSSNGRGGDVSITAGTAIRLEDTRIDAASFGDGRSGDIAIATSNRGKIELIGTQVEQIDIFNDPEFVLSTAEAVIFVDAFGSGGESLFERQAGGDLSIRGGEIKIDNYNLVSRVNSFSEDIFLPNSNTEGNAGDIFIAADSLTIANSSLVVGTLGNGSAGNIELIVSGDISLREGTQLNTRTVSEGSAGIVSIDANSLTVDASSITASNEDAALGTRSEALEVFAGNINLDLTENLILRNDSTISAIANGNANGGIITIEANSIIAFPPIEKGSDIIASATAGRGGTIDIIAESIFGIQENSQTNSSNDIDASSGVDGLDGTVSITTSDVDALRRAVELASDTLNPDNVATRTCASNPSQKSTLAVKNTIRTPPNINRPLISENIIVNGRISSDKANFTSQAINLHDKKIVPARGVAVDKNGEIALVAYPTPDTMSSSVSGFMNCSK